MKFNYITPSTFLLFIIIFFITPSGCAQKESNLLAVKQETVSVVCVQKGDKFGFLDDNGKEIIPCEFDADSSFSEGWVALKKGKNWAYYDTSGRKVLDLKKRFTYCGAFHDGVAFVSERRFEKYGSRSAWNEMLKTLQFIDRKGQVIFKIENAPTKNYQNVRTGFSNGLLKLTGKENPNSKEHRYGYLDKQGNLQIPFKFPFKTAKVKPFSEGLASVYIIDNQSNSGNSAKKYGYINQTGNWAIFPTFKYADPFENGVAMVGEAAGVFTRYFLINPKGNLVFPPVIESYPRNIRDTLVAVFTIKRNDTGGADSRTKRHAIARTNGTMITDFKYRQLTAGIATNDPWIAQLPNQKDTILLLNDQGTVITSIAAKGGKFENGLAIIKLKSADYNEAVINTQGEIVMPPDPDIIRYQLDGGVISKIEQGATANDYKISYYNKNGELIPTAGYVLRGTYQLVNGAK
ncbi:MAG: WG repeat-containing protein [Saprospiraceae bacterium]